MTNYAPFLRGLRPKVEDKRDLQLGQVFPLPKLAELPEEYRVPVLTLDDQKSSDFCAASASSKASEYQEGEPLSFEYLFAVAKQLEGGDPDAFGLQLRTVMKAHQKIGTVNRKQAPYSLENKPASFLRRIENWPATLLDLATLHRKKAYIEVAGPYDHYDNLRAAIWLFRQEKRLPVFGVVWSWPLDQVYIDEAHNFGEGHAVLAVGWTKDGLVVQNSKGTEAGDKGYHIFSREVINKFVKLYGSYMFVDLEPEEVKKLVEQKQLSIIGRILAIIAQMIPLIRKNI